MSIKTDNYKIMIEGHLDKNFIDYFEGMTISLENDGKTIITLMSLDQAALHGLIKRIRDLGMSLVSINRGVI